MIEWNSLILMVAAALPECPYIPQYYHSPADKVEATREMIRTLLAVWMEQHPCVQPAQHLEAAPD